MIPGFETLTLPLLIWIAVVIFIGGVSQGALGIGFPTISTPLIALVTDIRTAVIIVLLPCVGAVVATALKGYPLRRVLAEYWMMPIYMVIGAAIGTQLFIAFPAFPYALLLAGMILVYLNLDRFTRSEWPFVRRYKGPFGFVFGVLAGLSEGTANVAAPALIIYYLAIGIDPAMLVQAMNICFFVGKTTQFATLATAGGVPPVQWAMTIPFVALAAGGAIYGISIRSRIPAATYRQWLKGALLVMAVILIGQYLYEL